VEPAHDIKSIGHEQTYLEDINDKDMAKKELLSLANKTARRMRRENVTGKSVTLKVKYNDFVQITRSKTLPKPIDDGFQIYSTACSLLEKTEVGKRPIRLLGISLSQLSLLETERQLTIFNQEESSQKRKRLNTALDSLHEKHGDKSIRPGTLLIK